MRHARTWHGVLNACEMGGVPCTRCARPCAGSHVMCNASPLPCAPSECASQPLVCGISTPPIISL
eukprot:358486-Chlamydomonas_euryale.AAC.20